MRAARRARDAVMTPLQPKDLGTGRQVPSLAPRLEPEGPDELEL
jgi:hypothetical protein